MSDFASLLNSFKETAASAAAAPAVAKSNDSDPSRKRQFPSNSSVSFPSFRIQFAKRAFHLSFVVIGGQKCGTTWLHKLLQKCNHISLPAQKEIHFWDWNYRKGVDWYIRQFNRNDTIKLGEITPDYVVLPPTTIEEIHKCFPGLKIVFIARDLVERTWSAMIMELRDQNMGLNPGEFAEGVIDGNKKDSKRAKVSISAAQQRRIQQTSSPSSQPDSYFMERLQHDTHKSRSDYAGGLKHWYEYFPDDSILLIDYRDIQTDPRGVLYKIVTHIGVENDAAKQYIDGLNEAEIRQRINASAIIFSALGNTYAEKVQKDSYDSLSNRPLLKKQMEMYLLPYATSFNVLLREKKYDWSLNDYKIK